MSTPGELPIGTFDFIRAGLSGDAQDLVIVAKGFGTNKILSGARASYDLHRMSAQEQSGGPVMAFGDHLEELRRRLLFALAPIVPVFVLLFWLADGSELLVGPAFEVLASSGTSAGFNCSVPRKP